MVRVAGLVGQLRAGMTKVSQDGMSPSEQLRAITYDANQLMQDQQRIWQQPRLLTSAQSTDFSEIASVYHWPAMAAGRCLPHVLTDSFIAMTFHQPQALAFWNALLGMSPSGEGEHPSASWIVREPVTTVLHDDRARLRAQSLADLSPGYAAGYADMYGQPPVVSRRRDAV